MLDWDFSSFESFDRHKWGQWIALIRTALTWLGMDVRAY